MTRSFRLILGVPGAERAAPPDLGPVPSDESPSHTSTSFSGRSAATAGGAPGDAASRPGDELAGSSGRLLYTPAEAARLLTVPESWLRRKAAARAIPCT